MEIYLPTCCAFPSTFFKIPNLKRDTLQYTVEHLIFVCMKLEAGAVHQKACHTGSLKHLDSKGSRTKMNSVTVSVMIFWIITLKDHCV